MKKQRLTIVMTENDIKTLKKHSKETGYPVSIILTMATKEYFKQIEADKPVPLKPEKVKSRVRQCRNDECFYAYDTSMHDSCPKCGTKEVFHEED